MAREEQTQKFVPSAVVMEAMAAAGGFFVASRQLCGAAVPIKPVNFPVARSR